MMSRPNVVFSLHAERWLIQRLEQKGWERAFLIVTFEAFRCQGAVASFALKKEPRPDDVVWPAHPVSLSVHPFLARTLKKKAVVRIGTRSRSAEGEGERHVNDILVFR